MSTLRSWCVLSGFLFLAVGCDENGGAPDAGTDGQAPPSGRDAGGRCGDGVVGPGEACDDGNTEAFDGCDPDCTFTCVDSAECDDGIECNGAETCGASSHRCENAANLDDGTSCADGEHVCRNGECVTPACGDGVVDEGESCDDGNGVTRDGCENDCRFTCEHVDPSMLNTWHLDCDGDGYAANDPSPRTQCLEPPADTCGGGWTLRFPVTGAADCNDTNPAVSPGATEVCDGIDNDCNEGADEGLGSIYYADNDGDGHGNAAASITACAPPAGYVGSSDDCNDAVAAAFPGNPEVCDGIDNNCSGMTDEGVTTTFYADNDGDGHGNAAVSMIACTQPTGYVTSSDDCNDGASNIHPGRAEACDTIDNDCDTAVDEGVLIRFYRDADGDGYGNAADGVDACLAPTGRVTNNTDCCDTDNRAFPGQTSYQSTARIGCGGYDFDCDGGETKQRPNCQDACSSLTTSFTCDAEAPGWVNGCSCSFFSCTSPACGTVRAASDYGTGCSWSTSTASCRNSLVFCPIGGCPSTVTQGCR